MNGPPHLLNPTPVIPVMPAAFISSPNERTPSRGSGSSFSAHEQQAFASLQEKFLAQAPRDLEEIRELFRTLLHSNTGVGRFRILHDRIANFSADAQVAQFFRAHAMAEALEKFIAEKITQKTNLSASEQRTTTQAIDTLEIMHHDAVDRCMPSLKQPLILCIDDEATARQTMKHCLKRIGYTPVVTGRSEIVLNLVQENRFDVITMDVMMPEMDGFELTQQIRLLEERGEQPPVPVIFVTGISDFNKRVKSSAAGGTEFIAKPFHHHELALKIQTLLLRQQIRSPADE